MAVGLVTILYTLVTMAYALACPFSELVGQDLGIVTHFAPLVRLSSLLLQNESADKTT
jgi:hypothetical protein